MSHLKIKDFALELEKGQGFYNLKVNGHGEWLGWEQVSPAELAAISSIVNQSNAYYDPDKKIFKSSALPIQQHGLSPDEKADIPWRE